MGAPPASLKKLLTPELAKERDEERRTLLHWAADGDHLEAIRTLVGLGADIDAVDDEELTPLAYAACNDYAASAQLLVDLGADKEAARVFARGELASLLAG